MSEQDSCEKTLRLVSQDEAEISLSKLFIEPALSLNINKLGETKVTTVPIRVMESG